MWGDEDTGDEFIGMWDDLKIQDIPTPYIWESETEREIIENWQIEQDTQVSIEVINNLISSFREKGEWYYVIAQETSDIRIYKYAMKMLSLCDDYEKRISNWEWMDKESYESFNVRLNNILTKIYEYDGGSEVKTISAWNVSKDESVQEDYRKYLEDRADWLVN